MIPRRDLARHKLQFLVDPGAYGYWNVGDIAMTQVAIERIRNRYPAARICAFTIDPESLRTVLPGVHGVPAEIRSRALLPGRLERAVQRRIPASLRNLAKPLEILRDTSPLRELVRASSAIVVSGMGGVNDLFDNGLAIVRLLRLAQSEQKPTFLLGQGLGPIENPLLREEASNVFARTELIGVRESAYSPQLAISLGAAPDKVHVTGDDALDLAHQYTPDCLGDALGVNLRLASYSDVGVEFVAKVRKVLDEVKCRLQAHMLPVPISFRPTESDLDTCEALGVTRPESVSCIPSDVIRLAGRCRVVVTGAYHAGVFSLAQGVPVVGISNSQYYDYKLLGLASMFPGACDVISLADPEFEDRLLMSICAKWESAPRIRQEILRRTQSQIRESRLLYQKMLDSLENRSVAGSAESPVRNPEPPQ